MLLVILVFFVVSVVLILQGAADVDDRTGTHPGRRDCLFQVLQGTFSAMIMTILSILCAMAAVNYYEPLAAWILSLGQYHRDATYIYPASLIAVFFVPLLGVRLIFDRLLTGNVGFGLWADRIVGGVFGVITGMVLVGMLGIAMQMLPWDAAIIGYKPYDDCLQRDMSLQPLLHQFVLATARQLSAGSLKLTDENAPSFGDIHPDLLLESQAERNRCELPGRCDAKPGAPGQPDDDRQRKALADIPVRRQRPEEGPRLAGQGAELRTDLRGTAARREPAAGPDLHHSRHRRPRSRRSRRRHERRLVPPAGDAFPSDHAECFRRRRQNHYYYPVAFLTWLKNPGKKMTPWQAITQSTDATPKLAKSGYLLAERTVAAYSEGVTGTGFSEFRPAKRPAV